MCTIIYYIKTEDKNIISGDLDSLMAIQKCARVEVRYIEDYEKLEESISVDFPGAESRGKFFLQMLTPEFAVPANMRMERIEGNYREKKEEYIEILKSFIRLSKTKDRFSVLRRAENLQGKESDIALELEKAFRHCYGHDLPMTGKDQLKEAVMAMEKKWEDEIQSARRNSCGSSEKHFYQIVWFGNGDRVEMGREEDNLICFSGKMSTYSYLKEGGSIVKYDIREYFAVDQKSLEKLVQAYKDKVISEENLILHVQPISLTDVLATRILEQKGFLTKGKSNSHGAVWGKVILGNEPIDNLKGSGEKYILVKDDLTPLDIEYIYLADGVITGKCSSTSHQAIVAKQLGKVFLYSCDGLVIEENGVYINDTFVDRNETLSIDGGSGKVYLGKRTISVSDSALDCLDCLMDICGRKKELKILINTEEKRSISEIRRNQFEGIGLYRTEYMPPQRELRLLMREAILATDFYARQDIMEKMKRTWIHELSDVFNAVGDKEITIRTLDYPSQELFFGLSESEIRQISKDTGSSEKEIRDNLEELVEQNGMLGNRGCRFSITYPAIFETQIYSIFEAYRVLPREKRPGLNIMLPMVALDTEVAWMRGVVNRIVETNPEFRAIDYQLGIMIETPRAVLTFDSLISEVDFVSFGTNDLTQFVWGMSREDYSRIINIYKQKGLVACNPFETLDNEGIMPLISYVVKEVKEKKKKIRIGVCGGQAFASEKELCSAGVNYISISPSDVPYALLTAAQEKIKKEKEGNREEIKIY